MYARRHSLIYLRSAAVVIGVWFVASVAIGNPVLLPSPFQVARDFASLVMSGEILRHAATSSWRLVLTFVLAALIGMPLGIAMGLNRTVDALVDPVVELLRPISAIAWIPIALFTFGIGNALPIFIMVYVSVFPFILNTVAGVRAADPVLARAALTMGVPRRTIVQQVILPSAVPSILTGARLSAGGGWMALIAAELVGAPSGLGFAIQYYGGLLRTSDMLAVVVMVAVLGYLTDVGLRMLQRTMTPWIIQPDAVL